MLSINLYLLRKSKLTFRPLPDVHAHLFAFILDEKINYRVTIAYAKEKRL